MTNRLAILVTAAGAILFSCQAESQTFQSQSYHDNSQQNSRNSPQNSQNGRLHDLSIAANAIEMFQRGRDIFRFDTFGDEAFWGDTLKLHRAIAGEQFGGVGPGVSPRTALAVGLK